MKAEYAVFVAFPDWKSVRVAGFISYQRTSDLPVAANVVCCVHSPTAFEWPGSTAETACVGRVSEVSISFVDGLFWVALAGIE